MDLQRLKTYVLGAVAYELDGHTHRGITEKLIELQLPSDLPGSKKERIQQALEGIDDGALPGLAKHLIATGGLRPADRNAIEDALWTDADYPAIRKRTRREIAAALNVTDLFIDARKFDALLSRLWVLRNDSTWTFLADITGEDDSLYAEIAYHIHGASGCWSVLDLFDKLGAFEASDRRFALFLEGLASPDIRPDEESQRRFVGIVNGPLKALGLELHEVGLDGGYPVFELLSKHVSPRGRPKQLIFASSVKPDLRFSDAIDNDIEIVTGKDEVLVYDRAIGVNGLRWWDLQAWWKDRQSLELESDAKNSLYKRLVSSLPTNSPPQRALFDGFYRTFSSEIPQLPALLPEVWLHWDPKTIRLRGRDALLNSRMDFLILLPGNVRVVIEVDGQQHYAEDNGRASPRLYAKMVAADRDLRLAGYEVYRFGAHQLCQSDAMQIIGDFFASLFRMHGVRELRR
ncbi:hypothetical protein SAMN04487939_104245 [Lysobacter sp. yr284]|uniref:AbiJ-related protein n=1 Tax=Lysobacter sp. yr284 TaxID=1761791 RepID=UPI000896FFA3|nr:hypothetical protein [Lysobacter sp. yr284]SDY64862.1 hypothetical protein SAMN04487939_104245 [Lysobacter sp. yr284]